MQHQRLAKADGMTEPRSELVTLFRAVPVSRRKYAGRRGVVSDSRDCCDGVDCCANCALLFSPPFHPPPLMPDRMFVLLFET